jgi:hypothetical protein
MSKKTAIEWLAENYLPLKRGIELGHEHTLKVVQQAKAIEKQQIIDTYIDASENPALILDDAEQYYNETYNK